MGIDLEKINAEHRRHIDEDHSDLIMDAAIKAQNIRGKDRVRRLGLVLAHGLTENAAAKPDEVEEMLGIAMTLFDLDVEFLRQMNWRPDRFKQGGAGLASIDQANEDWKEHRPRIKDVDRSGGQSIARRLERFGLIESIERRNTSNGPDETPFRMLRRGVDFLDYIKEHPE